MIVFGAEDLTMPPLFENNPHDTMGSYHLHVQYNVEDSQEVTPKEGNSFDMIGYCCSLIENNSENINQLDDSMNPLSTPPIEEKPTEDELKESYLISTSHPIFPNVVLVININYESMVD